MKICKIKGLNDFYRTMGDDQSLVIISEKHPYIEKIRRNKPNDKVKTEVRLWCEYNPYTKFKMNSHTDIIENGLKIHHKLPNHINDEIEKNIKKDEFDWLEVKKLIKIQRCDYALLNNGMILGNRRLFNRGGFVVKEGKDAFFWGWLPERRLDLFEDYDLLMTNLDLYEVEDQELFIEQWNQDYIIEGEDVENELIVQDIFEN